MTSPDPAATLAALIEARARQLADERISVIAAMCEARLLAFEQAYAHRGRRDQELRNEMRRQIGALDRFQQRHVHGACTPIGE